MEHNKQLYEHLFQAIRKQLESGLARTEGNDAFNIFKVLGIADKEVLICRLLGELLDPKGSHGLGAKPLSLFLERLRIADRFSPARSRKRTWCWKRPSTVTAGSTLSSTWGTR